SRSPTCTCNAPVSPTSNNSASAPALARGRTNPRITVPASTRTSRATPAATARPRVRSGSWSMRASARTKACSTRRTRKRCPLICAGVVGVLGTVDSPSNPLRPWGFPHPGTAGQQPRRRGDILPGNGRHGGAADGATPRIRGRGLAGNPGETMDMADIQAFIGGNATALTVGAAGLLTAAAHIPVRGRALRDRWRGPGPEATAGVRVFPGARTGLAATDLMDLVADA